MLFNRRDRKNQMEPNNILQVYSVCLILESQFSFFLKKVRKP